MEPHQLMFELSHPERLKMLKLLSEDAQRLTFLSKYLNITTAEVARHLERLKNVNLVEKKADNRYYITLFGQIVLREHKKLVFLTEHYEYFLNHNALVVPQEVFSIDYLARGGISRGTLENASLIRDISVEADEYVHLISPEIMRSLVDVNVEKMDSGVKFKFVYPTGITIPEEYLERVGKGCQIRLLERVPLAIKMNEKFGGLSLPNPTGELDYDAVLVGEDISFRTWLGTVFDYFWRAARSV